MMKSFFKKLAFVMALAMVVSLAAPAGSALAADYSLNVTVQGTKVAIKEYNLEKVGDTVDFQFWKAPSNWADDYEWDYTVPGIVAVDKAGVVTALAEGTTTVTITVLDQYYGAVEVTVGEKVVEVEPTVAPTVEPTVAPTVEPTVAPTVEPTVEPTVAPTEAPVDMSYTYKQVSHNTATFTFKQDVNFAVTDVTLTKVFEGGYEVNWPIETFKCEKNVVTIAPYVEFADGDVFVIRIGAEDEGTTFKTQFGAVDWIEVSYKSLDKDAVAYAKLDEDDDDIDVILDCKLYSNGVDVTNANGYSKKNVEYAFLDEDYADAEIEEEDINNDGNDEWILRFVAPGKLAMIKAVYTYDDEEDPLEFKQEPIISEPAPKYSIVSVDKFTIVKEGTEEIDWNKATTEWMPAFDDAVEDDTDTVDYAIAVLMTDSLGNKIVYPSKYADISKKINDKPVRTIEEIRDEYDDAEYYSIAFKSTNDNKVFVGTDDGIITTIGKSEAPILVSLYDEDDDNKTYLVKNLTALPLVIKAKREADKVKADVKFDVLPSDGTKTTGKVVLTVVDQYDAPYVAEKIEVKDEFEKVDFTVPTPVVDMEKATYTYTFDGKNFLYGDNNDDLPSKAVRFAVTVDEKVKTSFAVKVDEPKYKGTSIKVDKLVVTADSKDMKIAKKADGTVLYSNIEVVEISNKLQVGTKDDNITLLTQGSPLLKDGKGELKVPTSQAVKGNVYVVIYDKDGKALKAAEGANGLGVIEKSAGVYQVRVAANNTTAASGTAMSYMDAGDYTVKVYEITDVNKTEVKDKTIAETKFTLSNSTAAVTLAEQKEVDLTGNDAMDINDVIAGAFKFKFGSDEMKTYVIDKVSYKYSASSGRVYIYNVEFFVPLNNGSDNVYFKSGKVTVNKYVEIDSLNK